ncbi:class I SAM-dependent methyltransferase [Kribbella sp. NPDC026596]|uniref:class I SAM-dependent methyltransferase n=1 Tax=Kribbella sp. NPDC026596 TaxID=3155122 RepID=UPI0033EF213E
MEHMVNTQQAEAWNGYEGRHWADNQSRWDAVADGVNQRLLAAAAIGAGDHVLDIGCGNGRTTRLAAALATRGRAVGIDLSGPMLDRGRASAEAEGLANVEFRQADAQVHPFEHGGFDVAMSRGGVMFFADPVVAFGNIGTALRSGGRLAIATLRDIEDQEWFTVLMTAVLGEPPQPNSDPHAPGMFSLADPAHVDNVLTQTGFTGTTCTRADVSMTYGTDAEDAATFWLTTGPVRHLLERGAADKDELLARLVAALKPFETSDGVQLAGSYWIVTAWT